MVPGRVSFLTAGPRWRLASATVGIAKPKPLHCFCDYESWSYRLAHGGPQVIPARLNGKMFHQRPMQGD
jgi:hypothetical protein